MFEHNDMMMGSKPDIPGSPTQYSTTSATLSQFTVPQDGQVEFIFWGGAGGGSGWGTYPGGPGGYSYAKFEVLAGQVIKYGAGQGGVGGASNAGPSAGGVGAGGYGNGGTSGTSPDPYNHGGSGGGATVGMIDNVIKTVAGGGAGSGGEGNAYRGGSGGGTSGGNGTGSNTGGTQTAAGGNASGMNGGAGTNSREAGGGGGGGWFGGGGGIGSNFGGGGTGAGGGSGYVAPDALASDLQTAAFMATQPPNTASPYYSGSAGVPTNAGTTSNAGLAVVVYRPYV